MPEEAVQIRIAQTKQRNSDVGPWIIQGLPHTMQHQRGEFSLSRIRSLRARYYYSVMFLIANLMAWCVRDYGQKIFPRLQYLKACGNGGEDCSLTMGVLRVSLGCFTFFFLMFLTTCNTSKLHESRHTWHSRWWTLKTIIFIVSLVSPFFIPSEFVQLYGELARVGAGIFLILQLISVIEFISWWNNYWMPDERRKQSCFLGLFMSTLFYIASVCGIGVMFSLYAPKISCTLNIFFIAWTAILLMVMMAISLHSKVNRGLLSSGIMASYLVFLCWSAIRSEPAMEKCSPQRHEKRHVDWTGVLGFLIAICASHGNIFNRNRLSNISAGTRQALSLTFFGFGQFRRGEVEREDDIPYKYGFFHLIFSLGAMYFAMLFISWNLDSSTSKWSIDVGWASTWVKIVNEWFAATIYLWKLIYPAVRQTKVMDHAEQEQDFVLP